MGDNGMEAHSHEVVRGTFWGLAGTFFIKIISFLYTIYVARAVSQGDVGLFYLSLGIVGLFGVWKDFGLPAALTRYVPYYESRKEFRKVADLLKNTFIVNAASGIFLTALIWAGAGFIGDVYQNPALPEALRLMSSFMLLDNLVKITGSYLQGRAEIKLGQALGTAQVVAKLVLTYLLFQWWGANLASLTVAFLASTLFAILISLPIVYKRVSAIPAGGAGLSNDEIYKEIVPFGIMLTVLQTFYTIMSSTDRVILGYLVPHAVSNDMVAIYSLAVTLGINIMVFPGAVGSIFLPLISRMVGREDHTGMKQAIGSAQRWVLFITLPMAAVMIAFSTEMLASFYGSAYAGGGTVMAIFIIGLIFSAFSSTVQLALAGMRLIKLELKVAVVAGVANVILNFALIPHFGMEGAAFAAAVSFAISALLLLYYGKRIIGFESPSGAYRLLIAGAITCILVFLLKPYVAAAADMIPAFGGAQISPYIQKGVYLGLLGAVSVLSFVVFGLLSLPLRCFGAEDVPIAKKLAAKAYVPESIISLMERILVYGVPKRKREEM